MHIYVLTSFSQSEQEDHLMYVIVFVYKMQTTFSILQVDYSLRSDICSMVPDVAVSCTSSTLRRPPVQILQGQSHILTSCPGKL